MANQKPDIDFDSKKVCIIGAGGHAKEVFCCLMDVLAGQARKASDIACFLVADKDFHAFERRTIFDTNVIPQSAFDPQKYLAIVAVGDPVLRKKIVEQLPADTSYITLIHPSAQISKWVEIGYGSYVAAGCILTCDISIGKHSHLNLNTTISHDCVIGNFFTTTPGTNVSGACHFGDRVYLGANSAVRQGITICDDVTIGMGGVVVKDITEPGVYVGNPAKKLVRS